MGVMFSIHDMADNLLLTTYYAENAPIHTVVLIKGTFCVRPLKKPLPLPASPLCEGYRRHCHARGRVLPIPLRRWAICLDLIT